MIIYIGVFLGTKLQELGKGMVIYMDQIFYWILNMAVVGTIVGGALLLIRRIRKLPRNFIYVLYSIVLIRFLCPFGFTNGFSFLNLLPRGTVRNVNPFTGEEGEKADWLLASNIVQRAESYRPWKLRHGWADAYEIGAWVWIVIALALLLCFCFMYFLSLKELRNANRLSKNIYQSSSVTCPMVAGVFFPKIFLPMGVNEQSKEFPYLLAHEMTHIKKKDNLWRLIAIILACVYWFNPMIWILMKYFFVDMELACDESTIRRYSLEHRKNYASALLSFAHKEPNLCATAFAGGNVRIRIKRVLNYKQVTLISTVSLVGLFLLFVICFLSNQ